jgi:hypothetical protein
MESIEYQGKQMILVYFTQKELEALLAYSRDHKTNVARVCRDCTLDTLHAYGYLEDRREK